VFIRRLVTFLSVTFSADGTTATGVRATVTMADGSRAPIVATSRVVVCSAGSLHSPAVLLRSGLKNWHIGRHLALHPVAGCAGFFGNEDLRKMYGENSAWGPGSGTPSTGLESGISMGIVVRSDIASEEKSTSEEKSKSIPILYGRALTADISRERTHGIWRNIPAIETPPIHPALMGTVLPWDSGLGLKLGLLLRNNISAFIGIARDLSSATNRVTLNSDDQPVIKLFNLQYRLRR